MNIYSGATPRVNAEPATDTEAATAFLQAFAPKGPWVLTAIGESRGAPTITFCPSKSDQTAGWIAGQQAERRNIYFLVGEPAADLTKKATKQQIARIHYLWADLDVKADLNWSDADATDAEMKVLQSRLGHCPIRASAIVASGGGLQAYWKLAEPFEIDGDPARIAEAEQLNRTLAANLNADHCHNVDRIMRLPGTVNFPNAQKKARGRSAALARLLHFDQAVYSTLDFAVLERVACRSDRKANPKRPNIPPRLLTLVRTAHPNGKRSEAFWAACCALFHHGFTEKEALACFQAEPEGVAAKFVERGNLATEVNRVRAKWTSKSAAASSGSASSDQRTQTDNLIDCASDVELFVARNQAYACVPVAFHIENHPIAGKFFERWLRNKYYSQRGGKAPNAESLRTAIKQLEAKAFFEGEQCEVHLRIAQHNGAIYLDLADSEWRSVRIGPDGWEVVTSLPVRFVRNSAMQPLPLPVNGGSLISLRRFINVKCKDDFVLIVAWLLGAFRPEGPYPVLALTGEQGSAKTTAATILRGLFDPNQAPLRALPRDERDLFASANASWSLAFDNVSNLPDWLSDALCRLSTGGGFAARQLYTDGDEAIMAATRPIILNGIEDMVVRPDLADRSLLVELARITDRQRKPLTQIMESFQEARPLILGAICDAVSQGLREWGNVQANRLPRMADFAKWVIACELAVFRQRRRFTDAYDRNRHDATDVLIDADMVASAVRNFMEGREPRFEATATELLNLLRVSHEEGRTNWPKTANGLSGRLKRAAPVLSKVGIAVTHARYGKDRTRKIVLERHR